MAGTARGGRFGDRGRRPRWGTLALVIGLHLAAIAGLIRAFAPDLPGLAIERAAALVSVPLNDPPPPVPEPEPEPVPSPEPSPLPEEGAAAPEAMEATPAPVIAPPPRIHLPRPLIAPPVPSEGTANTSGAGESGAGTGAGGQGAGTGSGREGSGRGGTAVSPPVKIAGDINDARDYPVPPGGREIRRGHSVIVHMIVGTDGRARDCRVIEASPDPQADRITCSLAEERFRFQPARDAEGNPVEAAFGWRQEWF